MAAKVSKIEKELVKATGIEAEDGEKRSAFLARLLKAVGKLAEKDWEALSGEAQDWYNENADKRNAAKKADKPIPDCAEFPDLAAEEEEKPKGRSRAKDDDEDDKPSKDSGSLKVGVKAKVVTKKGKTYEGEVIELDDEIVVIKDAEGKETEIDLEKIESKEVFHGDAGGKGKRDKDEDDEPADPLKKGAEVKLVTKRGKEVTGTIVDIDDEEIVLKTDDGEEEFRRDRVESITPVGGKKTKPAAKEEEEEKPRGKGKSDKKDEPEEKGGRAKNDVPVGTTITELIIEDMDASEEAIGKALKKKGIEAKENTVHLNYVAVHKVLAILKDKKLLKA